MKEYKLKINGNDYLVAVNSMAGPKASVTVNGTEYNVEIGSKAPEAQEQAAPLSAPADAAPAAAAPAGAGKAVTAPLPGVVIDICVSVGAKVAAGEKVAVIEAMKMENDIEAETAGTVTAINVSKGDSVKEGDKIVTIA